MSAVLVDSNVILDVVTDDPRWGEWSSGMLARCAESGMLVINPIIYALPDFYIGAHAAVMGLPLLTRDARRYRTYFPNLRLLAPEEAAQ